MGHVNKKLMRVELQGDTVPDPGSKVTVDGNEAEVTSAVKAPGTGGIVALAYVRVPRT